jgi:hypothetical protein
MFRNVRMICTTSCKATAPAPLLLLLSLAAVSSYLVRLITSALLEIGTLSVR